MKTSVVVQVLWKYPKFGHELLEQVKYRRQYESARLTLGDPEQVLRMVTGKQPKLRQDFEKNSLRYIGRHSRLC